MTYWFAILLRTFQEKVTPLKPSPDRGRWTQVSKAYWRIVSHHVQDAGRCSTGRSGEDRYVPGSWWANELVSNRGLIWQKMPSPPSSFSWELGFQFMKCTVKSVSLVRKRCVAMNDKLVLFYTKNFRNKQTWSQKHRGNKAVDSHKNEHFANRRKRLKWWLIREWRKTYITKSDKKQSSGSNDYLRLIFLISDLDIRKKLFTAT